MIDVWAINSSIIKILLSLPHSKNTREIKEDFSLVQKFN